MTSAQDNMKYHLECILLPYCILSAGSPRYLFFNNYAYSFCPVCISSAQNIWYHTLTIMINSCQQLPYSVKQVATLPVQLFCMCLVKYGAFKKPSKELPKMSYQCPSHMQIDIEKFLKTKSIKLTLRYLNQIKRKPE